MISNDDPINIIRYCANVHSDTGISAGYTSYGDIRDSLVCNDETLTITSKFYLTILHIQYLI